MSVHELLKLLREYERNARLVEIDDINSLSLPAIIILDLEFNHCVALAEPVSGKEVALYNPTFDEIKKVEVSKLTQRSTGQAIVFGEQSFPWWGLPTMVTVVVLVGGFYFSRSKDVVARLEE